MTTIRHNVRALALVACIAGAAAAATAPLGAQARVGSVRRAAPDSARDTALTIRVAVESGDLMRLIGELMASRQVEERIALSLREAVANDASRARELEAELGAIARRNASLSSVIRLQCARDEMMPEGYLGVNFLGIEVRRENGGAALYHFDSTRIVSVDPGSPAQRGGVEADDQLVAIGGYDVSRPVPLGTLLKPGARLTMRVLRRGQARDLPIVVGKRPEDASSPCTGLDDVMTTSRWTPQITIMRRPPEPPAAGGARSRVPAPSEPATFAFVTPFATSTNIIGGAQLLTLDADWRETVGVDRGLLVLSVAGGSPAEEAGLRKSDVIVSAGDSTLTSPVTLWRLMNQAGPNGVTLKVVRSKQSVTIVLKSRAPR